HLTGLGHRRIGVLEGTKATSTARQRTQGFTARLEQFGLALDPDLIATTDFRYEAAYAATTRLLASPEPPSAIFCHNDLLAIAAINAATRLGVDVPHELSVAGFDNTQQSSWETVDLTTVSQPLAAMAERAIDLLSDRLLHPELDPRHETFPCELVPRGSTAPASALEP